MKNKKVNKKIVSNKVHALRMSRLMLFLALSFCAVVIIGSHSDYIVKEIITYICFVGYSLTVFLFFVNIIDYFTIKEKISFKRIFLNALTLLYCVFGVSCLIVFYGPNTTFRDWFIPNAMSTMSHEFYCKIFYSDSDIQEVLSRNYIEEVDEEVDTSLVKINTITDLDTQEYEYDHTNIYETYIFRNHTKNEKYRLIRFAVNGQQAYLAIIYDPSTVSVAYTKNLGKVGEYVTAMAQRKNAVIAVNGGRFRDINRTGTGGIPSGVTLSNGKIISDRTYKSSFGVIGINNDNVLVLNKKITAQKALAKGIRDAVTSGPFLIVNGKASFTKGNGGYGFDARTAIGQREDGIMLLLVVDSNNTRTNGASMTDLTKIMQNYGAINAAALDGGTSSVMVENGVMINDPINASLKHKTRPVATAIVVQ